MWAVDHLALPGAMEMTAIPENQRNPACPIKCKMSPRSELLGPLTKLAPPLARGRQHRARIADLSVHACASRLVLAESCPRLEPETFGAFRAADAGFLSESIRLAECEELR
jgi:hypothetical protein